jgi:hypothetical protein
MIFVGTHHKMGTMLLTGVLTDMPKHGIAARDGFPVRRHG